jgi:DmsE family decaheme c-type cytochrome
MMRNDRSDRLAEVTAMDHRAALIRRDRRGFLSFAACVLGLLLATGAPDTRAQDEPEPREPRTCIDCHDDGHSLAILDTPHAVVADSRTPYANGGCIGCHGPSIDHTRRASRFKPDLIFGSATEASPMAEQNGACLGCHESGMRMHWQGSVHEREDVGCTSCHALHTTNDRVLAKPDQVEVCFDCHKKQRAEMHRPSTHPVMEGQIGCSDCHNAHGSNGPSLLARPTLNETCYACHAEKRGPFLWEHAPVREDCGNCHRPHGSTQPALLKARVPWLCQECHLAQMHPSTAYSGTGLPGAATPSGAQQILGKGCGSCHSQVHGSNHPSGARKTR